MVSDFLHFSLTAFSLAYIHMYATLNYNAKVNRCNSNPVSGLLNSAPLLAVTASHNFGCDAFRDPVPRLLTSPLHRLPIDPSHDPQLLISTKLKFRVSSGLGYSGCCGGLGGHLVVCECQRITFKACLMS